MLLINVACLPKLSEERAVRSAMLNLVFATRCPQGVAPLDAPWCPYKKFCGSFPRVWLLSCALLLAQVRTGDGDSRSMKAMDGDVQQLARYR